MEFNPEYLQEEGEKRCPSWTSQEELAKFSKVRGSLGGAKLKFPAEERLMG